MSLQSRIRNVTAVLGPTNTGKTHLAIERMLGHQSGMIGLPLRLLAREVYDKVAARAGADNVALVTGEEKIKPEGARYWVSTVEAMPRDVETDFLAIDEVQLAADPERGHVFTDRLLHARGRQETLMLGAGTMRGAIDDLIPGANFISKPRLSKLSYTGQKKITRLPKRTAIVVFSAAEVYAIAELIRRQIGGAAVVLGALSPRTRNAQVGLYQSGDVDYLVATDAIGMGLNLDVDHIAFAGVRKFDGHNFRNLTPGELGQVAGRAGRHMNDGTFGVTGDVEPFEADMIDRLENHNFDSVRVLQWRNRNLDMRSLEGLRESLRGTPGNARLQRARMADDVAALETLSADRAIADIAVSEAAVARLWEVCQVPDYRKISSQNHAELVATLYGYLMSAEQKIPTDWFARQVEQADRTDGDIDTLATRLAHIRTWTFVSNRGDWLADPVHWQERTRAIEDSLSDALHEQLTQRFVDSKTSALMKGLRDKEEMSAEIGSDGAIRVENHFVGRLQGFRFHPDTQSEAQGIHAKAASRAAAHVLSKELAMRARRVASARPDAFKLTRTGRVLWRDEEIARLEAGDDPLKPKIELIADEHLSGPDKEKVQARLDTWIGEHVNERLKPLVELKNAEDIQGLAKGIAFRLVESFGSLKREEVGEEVKQLDQNARAQLRKYGVRFGAFNIFVPLLLKPAAAEATLSLWALKHAAASGGGAVTLPDPPRPGLTSTACDETVPEAFYRAVGYHVCGPRAIRIDILERLADLIRPLLAWRTSPDRQTPPRGASGDGGFMVTSEMMSILGCSSEELGNVLRALGFRSEKRPAPPKPAPQPRVPAGSRSGATAVANGTAGDVAASEAEGDLADTAASESVTAESATAPDGGPQTTDAGTVDRATETGEVRPVEADLSAVAEPRETVEAAIADGGAMGDSAASAGTDATTGGSSAAASEAPTAQTDESADASPPVTAPLLSDAAPVAVDTPATTADAVSASAATPAADPNASRGKPADAVAAAEPELVDVWRPRRRERPDRRHGDQRGAREHGREPGRERERGGGGGRDQGRDRFRGDRNRDRRPHGGQRPGGPGQPVAAGAAEPTATGATPAPAEAATSPQPDRRDSRDNRPPRRDDRGPRRDDRRDGDRRDNREFRDRRRDDDRNRPQVRTSSPQRKGGPDPDSPFAALSALKQQLEKQAKERGSA